MWIFDQFVHSVKTRGSWLKNRDFLWITFMYQFGVSLFDPVVEHWGKEGFD